MKHSFNSYLLWLLCCWNYTLTQCYNALGTFDTPNLPLYLDGNDNKLQAIWNNAVQTGVIPDTNMTRKYEWTITRASASPDGVERVMILVNGQFPGPMIEANWGDTIQVTVHNNLSAPAEGTTIHWHGQPQKLSPWMDGVPAVSQCPIAPGNSFTYSFRAESYGSSWYHSHYSGQATDGLFGPMVIYGPQSVPYDIDLGPVLLNDYMHITYFEDVSNALHIPPVFLPLDNNLINGRNPFNCSLNTLSNRCEFDPSTRANFRFTSGKVHRLRLVNSGGLNNQKFSIDGHDLTVIANDYVEVLPYTTKVVTLGVGQRTDVLVTANGKPTDKYWMRSDMDSSVLCGNTTASQPTALAAVYYEEADTLTEPTTQGISWDSHNCTNDPLSQTIPLIIKTPPSTPAITQEFEITVAPNATGHLLFYVNNSTFRGDYNEPLLSMAHHGNTSYEDDPNWNAYNFHDNSSVRVIFKNYFPGPHPLHLHGHDFWVLAEGLGEWDGTVVNPENPQRRDTQIMAPGFPDNPSFVVLEWETDNPGIWALHCHILLHVSAGLYVSVIERQGEISQPEIPVMMAQTCQNWDAWTQNNRPDQIDSGLKI